MNTERRIVLVRRAVLAVVAVAVLAAGLRWSTYVAGGSDSYCYVNQAQRWASGTLLVPEPLVREAPWPSAAWTFAPVGHIPSPRVEGANVPMCPVGLSMVMAAFRLVGGPEAVFLVVPIFGAIFVAATWVIGSRVSASVGPASAIAAGSSPAFLFQLFQPMSDVPAAALWLSALAALTSPRRRATVVAGLLSGAAILVRPNLLPLGFVLGLFLLLDPRRGARDRLRNAAWYALGSAPGCLAVGLVQQFYYGSPLRSGYGGMDALFSIDNVLPNAARYATWLWQTHTPIWLLAIAGVLLLRGWLTALLFAVALANIACYLPYIVFDDWWYLRFLLPAIPLLLILSLAAVDRALDRLPVPAGSRFRSFLRAGGTPAVGVVLALMFITTARARNVFDLARGETRYVKAAAFVAERLPEQAIFIAGIESGSLRYYAGRRTIVWDALDTSWLDGAVAFARARGLQPYLLLETWEEPLFRRRFADSPLGALDWPPMTEIASLVRIYRPEDRDRYAAGGTVLTEYVDQP